MILKVHLGVTYHRKLQYARLCNLPHAQKCASLGQNRKFFNHKRKVFRYSLLTISIKVGHGFQASQFV